MTMDALRHHADANPGAVVEVGSDRMVDLSGEPGHVQAVVTDTGRDARGRYRKRVRVWYLRYGLASDVTERMDGERVPAGAMTPEDVEYAVGCHVEFIPSGRGGWLDNHVERVERYIRERWVPNWNGRVRVRGAMGDADE